MKQNRRIKISLWRNKEGHFFVKARCADVRVWQIANMHWNIECDVFLHRESTEILQEKGMKRASWLTLLFEMNASKEDIGQMVKAQFEEEQTPLYEKRIRIEIV